MSTGVGCHCLLHRIFLTQGSNPEEKINPVTSHIWFLFSFLNFLCCIGVYPINNLVIVSGRQQRDSAIHIPVSLLPQSPLPSRLPRNPEQSSLLTSNIWSFKFFSICGKSIYISWSLKVGPCRFLTLTLGLNRRHCLFFFFLAVPVLGP